MKFWNCLASSVAVLALSAGGALAVEPMTLQLSWKAQVEFAGFYQAKERAITPRAVST